MRLVIRFRGRSGKLFVNGELFIYLFILFIFKISEICFYIYKTNVTDVDIVCIHVEMASFRVTIVCFWNGSIRESNGKVYYVGGRRRLFVCNSNMDLNEFKRFICSMLD